MHGKDYKYNEHLFEFDMYYCIDQIIPIFENP